MSIKLLVALFACFFYTSANAQQSRVDSIVHELNKTKTLTGIDTNSFENISALIEKTKLTDTTISLLEKVGNNLIRGNDQSWSFKIRFAIMNSLITTDKNAAITYGKKTYEILKSSKTPNAVFIRSLFFRQLRLPYRNSSRLNEGFLYFNEKLKEFKIANDSVGLADTYYVLAGFYRTTGLIDQAIYNMKKAVSFMRADTVNDVDSGEFANPIGKRLWLNNISVLGIYYLQKGDYKESIRYGNISMAAYQTGYLKTSGNTPTYLAYAKILLGESDTLEYLLHLAVSDKLNKKSKDNLAMAYQVMAFYKIKTGALSEAEEWIKKCWKLIEENNIPVNARAGTIAPDYFLALVRIEQKRIEEARDLLVKDIGRLTNVRLDILRDYKLLAELYEQTGNHREASETYGKFIGLQDSLQADQDNYRSLSFETEQQMNEKELSINKLQSENKISSLTRNFSFGIIGLVLLLAGVVYYRYKSKQKANAALEKTLNDLQATQKQLIQSEKMASLGELTAGIAHEIQNPLNFVNNFSEVNQELLEELKSEKAKSKSERDEALENLILHDISVNLEKIHHHGKRADAIVKGMLQHSRSSSGQKEPTDINVLCDEYLRLCYHGLRAKDKSFNANMKTDFDESIGLVNIIPQDLGRVILNLLTNAFYVVNEKKKSEPNPYDPTVSISTKRLENRVEIKVSDNGNGIPQKVLDKIFQPFFTTKPTGQGTGLGLSLSYDIIAKGHGGELKVETKEGEGTTFIILLPVV